MRIAQVYPERGSSHRPVFRRAGVNLIESGPRPGGPPERRIASLGNCGDDTRLGGYSLITADDLDEALALAKGCPALQEGAGVEVGVIAKLNR